MCSCTRGGGGGYTQTLPVSLPVSRPRQRASLNLSQKKKIPAIARSPPTYTQTYMHALMHTYAHGCVGRLLNVHVHSTCMCTQHTCALNVHVHSTYMCTQRACALNIHVHSTYMCTQHTCALNIHVCTETCMHACMYHT